MKMGIRTPSPKRSFSARTTGKVTRTVKKATNPMYGKKGMGYINNPQKAVYNKVYNKTTTGANQVFGGASSVDNTTFDARNALIRINQLNETANIINSTTNVSTFFSRFDFALEVCDDLKKYEYTGVIKTITPEQQKRELLEQLPKAINSLIVRCRDKAYNNAQELKTDRGKHNRMVKFYETLIADLKQHGSQYITETNISKIKELITKDGLDSEIQINIAPTTIQLPLESQTITPSISSPYIPKLNMKMMCFKCKGIFIDKTICPECGTKLVEPSELQDIQDEKEPRGLYYFLIIICIILFIENILILHWSHSLSAMSVLILIIFCMVTHFYGKKT